MLVSYPLAYLVIRTIKETNYEDEGVIYVDDAKRAAAEAGQHHDASTSAEEKSSLEKESVDRPAALVSWGLLA